MRVDVLAAVEFFVVIWFRCSGRILFVDEASGRAVENCLHSVSSIPLQRWQEVAVGAAVRPQAMTTKAFTQESAAGPAIDGRGALDRVAKRIWSLSRQGVVAGPITVPAWYDVPRQWFDAEPPPTRLLT
jgi:hypothetical protein